MKMRNVSLRVITLATLSAVFIVAVATFSIFDIRV